MGMMTRILLPPFIADIDAAEIQEGQHARHVTVEDDLVLHSGEHGNHGLEIQSLASHFGSLRVRRVERFEAGCFTLCSIHALQLVTLGLGDDLLRLTLRMPKISL